MHRREFLVRTATAAGAAWLSSKSILNALAEQTLGKKFSASEAVREKIRSTHGDGRFYLCQHDAADEAYWQRVVETTLQTFGAVDVLVNNAGIYENKPFLQVDEAYLDRFLTTNLKGTFFTTQAVIPQMQRQHDGVVINIGTPLVYHAIGGAPATAPISSKGAIHALTLQLAAEFGKDNIRVNTIAPGVIRTPMHGDAADKSAGLHLLNRVGEVGDVAQMVYAVAKNNFVSGAIIDVDGGMGAGHNLH